MGVYDCRPSPCSSGVVNRLALALVDVPARERVRGLGLGSLPACPPRAKHFRTQETLALLRGASDQQMPSSLEPCMIVWLAG